MMFFNGKKKKREVHALMARMLNLSGMYVTDESDQRDENRRHRSFPVVLVPYEKRNGLSITEAAIAVTKDLSSDGASILVQQRCQAERLVVGIWFDGRARMVLCEVRHNLVLGGGFWQLGVEFIELLDADHSVEWQHLETLIEALEPRTAEPAEA